MMDSKRDAKRQRVLPTGGTETGEGKSCADENAADFAQYFCHYATLRHQVQMLVDRPRMDAYFHAITKNAACFRDKVVLDVGAGTGILAVWAAHAGARKVYAVEATRAAEHARALSRHNGVAHVVDVIQGTVGSVAKTSIEPVDIIVSEWMGFLLLRESMLDSVLFARDTWLKPGGAM